MAPFRDDPWRKTPPASLPADLQAALTALKARLAVPEGGGQGVDPAMTARYLAACRARGEPAQGGEVPGTTLGRMRAEVGDA